MIFRTYDAQGNPTSYLGHTLTWEKGRQLKSFDNTQYTYNANGICTPKTVNGIVHTFVLDGIKILKESWGSNTIIPMYDNEDNVCGIIYNDVPYYFFKNLQGDVIAIVDKDAQIVAKYTYDAWGVCTIESDISDSNIASVNPFRYRGYYYDSEIGMYYLQTRYYNPTVGRFINADEAEILYACINVTDENLFSYCGNNPILGVDYEGHFSIPSWTISIAIDAVIMFFAGVLKATWMTFMTPLKSMGKKAAAAYFTKHIAWRVSGIANSLISVGVKALIWIGKKTFAAAFNLSAKMAISAILNEPLRVVTACMSLGGLLAAIWDYFSDRKFNGWIKLW